jgi:hypothetical protein
MNNNNVFAVVLDDGETFSLDGEVVFLTQKGEEELDNIGDFDELIEDEHIIERVNIRDLVECWLRNTQNR